MTKRRTSKRLMWAGLALVLVAASVVSIALDTSRHAPASSAAFTPALDPGTALSGSAPDFTLTDQFGARVALHDFRGKVVILAFNDSQCTTICPLTTTAMVNAKRLLGAGGSRVALLGIDANPQAISVRDVRSYSEAHGMTRTWQFLTGSLPRLRSVWKAYHIDVAIERGQIDHTPALFVIGPDGRLAKLYLTQMSYASVEQQGQLLAQEASSLLPGHPRVLSKLSYAAFPPIGPGTAVLLPRAGGGRLALGPGNASRLFVFFATWDSQVTDLATQLKHLAAYDQLAAAQGLPRLTAVDEGSVEPSPGALTSFLKSTPLSYPVAIDQAGRVADGYGVQDEPWFVLVSGSGRFLWYYDISTQGWLSTDALVGRVRAALARPTAPSSRAAVQAALAGSPAPLNALHQQAGQLVGTQASLFQRLKALRGYPVVLNAWASWCGPCRAEFGLLSAASAAFGRKVAFIGADTSDAAGDARAFLAQHPVSYPSYPVANPAALSPLGAVVGLPTTVFIDRAGKVAYVHTGQYDSQGTLDQDISTYAR